MDYKKRIIAVVAAFSFGMLALIATQPTASASTVLRSIPKSLRGNWYLTESRGSTTHILFGKKTMKLRDTWDGKKLSTRTYKIAKKWTTDTHHFVFSKNHHGWYNYSLTGVNGVDVLKLKTVKISGHTYHALITEDMGGSGYTPKKLSLTLAFRNPTKTPHKIKISTSGMLN